MAIKLTGSLAVDNDIAGEFGGDRPHSVSEYYRGGSLVENLSVNNKVPESGKISISNFYGAINASTIEATIAGINTTTFAQTAINQDTTTDTQPGISGSWQKYYIRTFQGFYVTAIGTQITVPDMTITIRGDEEEDKIGSDENTGIKDPGVEIVYRSGRFDTPAIVGSFRGSGASTDDNSGNLSVSVTGGTVVCDKVGYYTIRWVADVYSEDIGQAPANIFIANSFTASSFGVSEYSFLIGRGWG